jgi:ABC-type antimicrobial peptide transport system permease subunit
MVFGISTTDLFTYLAGSLLLGAVAMTACLIPALKAAGTDPVEVMRTD